MFKLTKKGQASSTFQLLIAAVVALAILGVLITVISKVNPNVTNITTSTNQLLQQQVSNPGARGCTEKVTFKQNSTLSAEGITRNTGLDTKQIFFTNKVDEIDNFYVVGGSLDRGSNESVDGGRILEYRGSGSKDVTICVLCSGSGGDGLKSAMDDYGLNIGNAIPEYISPSGESVCVIYPKRTS